MLSSAIFTEGYIGIFVFSLIINSTLAVSYDIPGRSLGLISLGHAVFFGLGAYCFGIVVSKGFSFFPALFLSVVLSAVGALIVTLLMAGLNHGYYSIATLGILIIFQRLFETLESITGGSDFISQKPYPSFIATCWPLFCWWQPLHAMPFFPDPAGESIPKRQKPARKRQRPSAFPLEQ